jgi:hypothetical protein
MGNVLLVWEEVPEETKLYLIPGEVAEKYEGFLKDAHGNYINTVGWEDHHGLFFLNTALGEEVPEKGYEEYLGVLRDYKVDSSAPLTDANITTVYVSGFIL